MSKRESSHLPYPGLRPFEPYEADLFFGREEQVDALLKRLSNSHFVAVVGESGAGKSSLVRAGLLPALEAGFVVEAGSDWRIAVMRPGSTPLTALAEALLVPGVLSAAGGDPRREFALAELRRGPLGLVQLVRDARLDPHCNLLVVVDQFEELFRYCREPGQKDQANVFVELLLQATRQREVPILVVLTMRSDFIGDCARFRGLPERLNDNQFLTPRLTREQIAEAICGPARVCGGAVEAALVHELCNAVGDDQDQLPLLQHLLMRLWERASAESSPPRLTSELSRAMGGLHSALNNHAQQIYDSLSSEEKRTVARALFKSLTDPHSRRRDLRRDAVVAEVAAAAATPVEPVIAVADEFRADGRHMLMPPCTVPLAADSRLDISHESLIRQWSTLNEWAGEEASNAREFDRLREEARRERDGQGELLAGRDLVRAVDWTRQARPTPGWAERYSSAEDFAATLAFIRRSEEQENRKKDEELRRVAREAAARRSRYYNWMLGALLVVALGFAGWSAILYGQAEADRHQAETDRIDAEKARASAEVASTDALNQMQIATENAHKMNAAAIYAEEQRRRAEELLEVVNSQRNALARQRSQARSRQLAAETMLEVPKDPALAIDLAREALLEDRSEKRAVHALRKAIAEHVPSIESSFPVAKTTNYILGTNKSRWLDFSLYPSSLSSHDHLAIIPSGNSAIIWSPASSTQLRVLDGHENIVGSAAFSPEGRLAVTTSADNTARLWDVSSGKPLGRILRHGAMVNGAVFSADGRMVVTLGDDSVALAWNIGEEAPRCRLEHGGNFIAANFSRDGNYLVTVTHQNFSWQAQVWDVAGAGCPPVAVQVVDERNKAKDLKWASFSPYGPWLGVVTVEGKVLFVSTTDWKQKNEFVPNVLYPKEARREDRRPPAIAWNAGGSHFAAAGGDNVVRVGAIAKPGRPVELRGHTGRITSIVFHPDNDTLLTTSEDRTARVWKLDANKQPFETVVLRGHRDTVGSGIFSHAADEVITASDDGKARIWKLLPSLREIKIAKIGSINAASFSTDGKRIWVTGAGTVSELSATGPLEELGTTRIPSKTRWTALYANGGPTVMARTAKQGISVADIREPSKILFLPGSEALEQHKICPNGRFIVGTPSGDGNVKVWDVNTPEAPPRDIVRLQDGKKPCGALAMSPDGQRVGWYCAEQDQVLITRVGGQQRIATYIKDKKRVRLMQFSKNGRQLAVAFDDNSVQVFDSETLKAQSTMQGHTGSIEGLDYSRDERFLATVSSDDTARVWDVENGEEVALVKLPNRLFTGIAFSPDGLSLLLPSLNAPFLWRCYACGDAPTLLQEARQRKTPGARERNGRIAATQTHQIRSFK